MNQVSINQVNVARSQSGCQRFMFLTKDVLDALRNAISSGSCTRVVTSFLCALCCVALICSVDARAETFSSGYDVDELVGSSEFLTEEEAAVISPVVRLQCANVAKACRRLCADLEALYVLINQHCSTSTPGSGSATDDCVYAESRLSNESALFMQCLAEQRGIRITIGVK